MTAIKTSSSHKLPDGSKISALVQLINWLIRPFEYLEECNEKYGDMFTMRLLGLPPLVFIANPQGIKEIFSSDPKKFDVGRTNDLARPILGNNSLIIMDGSRHKRERKLLMPPFHGEKVKSYAASICRITEAVTSRWEIEKPFIARDVAQEITLKVIMQTVFGFSAGEKCERFRLLLADWLDITASPGRSSFIFLQFLQVDLGEWSPWGHFIRTQKTIYDLLQAEIDERRTLAPSNGVPLVVNAVS